MRIPVIFLTALAACAQAPEEPRRDYSDWTLEPAEGIQASEDLDALWEQAIASEAVPQAARNVFDLIAERDAEIRKAFLEAEALDNGKLIFRRRAAVIRLSEGTGLPRHVVARGYDEIQKSFIAAGRDVREWEKRKPALVRQMRK